MRKLLLLGVTICSLTPFTQKAFALETPQSNWGAPSYEYINGEPTFPNGLHAPYVINTPNTSDVETSDTDIYQSYERHVFYSNRNWIRFVPANYNYNDANMRSLLNLKDDTAFWKEVIHANTVDLLYALRGYKSPVSTPSEAYLYNSSFSDERFAAATASILRIREAKEGLKKLLPTQEIESLVAPAELYYARIKQYKYGTKALIVTEPNLGNNILSGLNQDLEKIPSSLKRITGEIQLKAPGSSEMAGYYGWAHIDRYIALNSQYPKAERVLYHEMGHIIDGLSIVWERNQVANSFSRDKEFLRVWNKVKGASSNHTFKTSNVEAFAEAFGRVVLVKYLDEDPSILKDVGGEEMYRYMEDMLYTIHPELKGTGLNPYKSSVKTPVDSNLNKKATIHIGGQSVSTNAALQEVYRLYHSGIKVHLYSTSANEVNVLKSRGWQQEGVSWKTETQKGEPIYRLYNPKLKVHLYTKDTNEYNTLAFRGWQQEGIAYRSYGQLPIYRLYHPGIKKHLYTKDLQEYKVLSSRGWKQEGVAFYAQ